MTESTIASNPSDPRRNPSLHCYASRYVICFEETRSRANEPAISVDGAEITGGKAQWDDKITLQLDYSEMAILASVCLGFLPEARFANHGTRKTKSVTFINQPPNIFCRVSDEGKRVRAVPIDSGRVHRLASMVLMQMVASRPSMTLTELIAILKLTTARLEIAAQGSPQGPR